MRYVPVSEAVPYRNRQLDQMIQKMEPVGEETRRKVETEEFDAVAASMPEPGAVTDDQRAQFDALAGGLSQTIGAPVQQPDQGIAPDVPLGTEPSMLAPAASPLGGVAPPMPGAGGAPGVPASEVDDGAFTAPSLPPPAPEIRTDLPGMGGIPPEASGFDAPQVARALGDVLTLGGAADKLGGLAGLQPGWLPEAAGRIGVAGAEMAQLPGRTALQGLRGAVGVEGGGPTGVVSEASGSAQTILGRERPIPAVGGEQVAGELGVPEYTDVAGINVPTRAAAGMAIEGVLDPLNYLPIGLGGKAKTAAEGLERAIRDGVSQEIIDVARTAARNETAKRAAIEGVGAAVGGAVVGAPLEEAGGAIGGAIGGEQGELIGRGAGRLGGALVGGTLGATRGADVLERAPEAVETLGRGARAVSGAIEEAGLTPGMRLRVEGEPPPPEAQYLTFPSRQYPAGMTADLTEATTDLAATRQIGGRRVGLPEDVTEPEHLQRIRDQIHAMAEEGKPGKYWYEESSKEIMDMFGGDKDQAEKFAQLLAIYSLQNTVDQNTTNALRAWHQFKLGQPIQGGKFGSMDDRATDLLYGGKDWDGRKTNTFYRNLMLHIDPTKASDKVTIDRWMLKAFGFERESPTDPQYTWMESETKRLADQLTRETGEEWLPHQAQAAIWTSVKARTEAARAMVKTGGELRGAALRSIEERIGQAKGSFATYLRDTSAQMSWESAPGRTSTKLPGFHGAPLPQRAEYHAAIKEVLTGPGDRDVIADALGIPSPGSFDSPGVYQGAISPGTQARAFAPMEQVTLGGVKTPENALKVSASAAKNLSDYAAIRAILLRQDGAGWTRPFYDGNAGNANAMAVNLGRVMTPDEATALDAAVRGRVGGDGYRIVTTDTGAWVVNDGQNVTDNLEFHRRVVGALGDAFPGDTQVRHKRFAADGDYFENNWSKDPNGEAYRRRLGDPGRSALLGRLEADYGPRIEAIDADFAARYGWDTPGAAPGPTPLAATGGGAAGPEPALAGLPRAASELGIAATPERATGRQLAEQGALGAVGAVAAQMGTDEDTSFGERITRGALGFEAGLRLRNRAVIDQISRARFPSPDVKHGPELQRYFDTQYAPKKQLAIHRDRDIVNQTLNQATHAWTDRGVYLNNYVKQAAEEVRRTEGRDLLPEEMAELQVRVNPHKQAEVFIADRYAPILREAGEDQIYLEAYLSSVDAIDKAAVVGTRVAKGAMPAPARRAASSDALDAARADLARIESDPSTLGFEDARRAAARKIRGLQTRVATEIERDIQRVEGGTVRAQAKGARVREQRLSPGGLTTGDHYRLLANIEDAVGPERFEKIQDLAGRTSQMMHDLLDMKVSILGQDVVDQLKTQYPNYVPIKILDYLAEQGDKLPRGKKIGLRDKGLRELTEKGTASQKENTLSSILRYAHDTHVAVQRNENFLAFKAVTDLAREHNLGNVIRPIVTEQQEAVYRAAAAKEKDAGALARAGAARLEIEPAADDALRPGQVKTKHWEVVSGFEDGVLKRYAVPKDMAELIQMSGGYVAPPVVQKSLAVWRMLQTTASPIFVPANAVLDASAFTLRQTVREGGPQQIPRVMLRLAKGYIDEFDAMIRGDYSEGGRAFLKAGGGQAGYFSGRTADITQTVENLTQSRAPSATFRGGLKSLAQHAYSEVTTIDGLRRMAKDILTLQPVQRLGERVEMVPRKVSYQMAGERGRNELQKMVDGRSITIDFAQGGTWAKAINQWVPFFNVGMQAATTLRRIVAEGRELHGNDRAALGTVGALLIAPLVGTEIWNRADEQREADYEDVPDYVKDQGIVVMWPTEAPVDERGDRRPRYTVIPLREAAPFAIFGREVLHRILASEGYEGNERSFWNLLGASINQISPIATESPANLFSSVNPLVLPNTALQLAVNKNFFTGRDIVTERADEEASGLAAGVASVASPLSEAIGGPEVRPSAIEFLGRDVGGGVFRTAGGASNIIEEAARSEDVPPRRPPREGAIEDIPVLGGAARRFVGSQVGEGLHREQEAARANTLVRDLAREGGFRYESGPVRGEIGGQKLNRTEQREYQRMVNEMVGLALMNLVQGGEWGMANPAEKEALLERAISGARKDAQQRLIDEIIGQTDWQARELASQIGAMGR